jgi:hypothetical protein
MGITRSAADAARPRKKTTTSHHQAWRSRSYDWAWNRHGGVDDTGDVTGIAGARATLQLVTPVLQLMTSAAK